MLCFNEMVWRTGSSAQLQLDNPACSFGETLSECSNSNNPLLVVAGI